MGVFDFANEFLHSIGVTGRYFYGERFSITPNNTGDFLRYPGTGKSSALAHAVFLQSIVGLYHTSMKKGMENSRFEFGWVIAPADKYRNISWTVVMASTSSANGLGPFTLSLRFTYFSRRSNNKELIKCKQVQVIFPILWKYHYSSNKPDSLTKRKKNIYGK
jgi:hypothetical protein